MNLSWPKIDIRPDHWEIVRSILQKHVPQHAVWAFGSRAKWTAKEYSDLDLAIITDKPLSLDTSASLSDDFSESDLPYKVDVVDWATTGESFRKIIERNKVVVQEAGRGWVMVSDVQWFEKPLGEVTVNHDGKRRPVKESERKKGPFPYYGASGIVDYVDGYLFEGRYLLIAEDGENLRTRQTPIAFMADGKFWVNNHAHIVTGNDEVTTEYLHYFLQNADIQSYLTGAVMPKLTQGNLNRIPVRYPEPDYQKLIVRVLGSLDAKIDINRRINQTLEAMAQAIFKSWFVDFDPVKAKIAALQEGRDPLRAAMNAISGKSDAELDALPPRQYDPLAATAALFPDAMEESELGEVPKGWPCGALGDICTFTAGSAFKPEHQGSTEGDYPFIKVSDMNLAGNEVLIQSANNYVSKAQQSEMKAKLHPLGATVFAKIGVALISNRRRLLTTPTIIDNNLMSASPIEGRSGPYFLYSMLSAIDFNTLVSGTALPYLNVSDLRRIPIVRPHSEAIRAYEEKSSAIFSMMQTMAAQSATLATTRDTLLPKLLSGVVEVSGTLEN